MFNAVMLKRGLNVGSMFGVKAKFQIQYFDRNIIRTNWKKINKSPLQAAGAMVMRIARGLIRTRLRKNGKPSPPGRPPYARTGVGGKWIYSSGTPPFKMIYSLPYNLGTSVIVGMVGFGKTNPVPGLMEHGGTAERFLFTGGGERRSKRTGRYMKRRYTYKRQTAHYPPRPFMEPALMRARHILPKMWQMSISVSQ